jgi:hypothetical protein
MAYKKTEASRWEKDRLTGLMVTTHVLGDIEVICAAGEEPDAQLFIVNKNTNERYCVVLNGLALERAYITR